MQDQISQIIRINMCLSCIRTSVLQNTESGRLNQVCIIFFRNCFRMLLLLWWLIRGSYLFISIRAFCQILSFYLFLWTLKFWRTHVCALWILCCFCISNKSHISSFLSHWSISSEVSFLNIVPSSAALGLHQNINVSFWSIGDRYNFHRSSDSKTT